MHFPSIPIWDSFVDLIRNGLLLVDSFVGNVGISIIIFTIILMLCMVPLMLPSLRNSRKQQELAPRVKELQKQYGKDRAGLQRAQMELYQQYGFNPMSGCLPLLIQWPFFFALWQAILTLAKSSEAATSTFLWIHDLAAPDPWHVLPVFAFIAQFIQTRMMMAPSFEVVDPQQQSMNRMMQFTPIIILFIGWKFAAGAVLYYVTSSVFRAVLQFFISGWGSLVDIPYLNKILPKREPKRLLPSAPVTDATSPRGKGGFMQRMQQKMLEVQTAQQEQQTARQQGATKSDLKDSSSNGAKAAQTSNQADEESQASDEANGLKYTDDQWKLPGAPGSKGQTSLVGTISNNNSPTPPRKTQNRQRNNSGRKNRRR